MPAAERPTYASAAWLFLRFLGVIYLFAFASLALQIAGLIGSDGILPARQFMDAVRALAASQHIGLDRFRLMPTLCWISTSDGFLRALVGTGMALAVLLVAGIAPVPVLLLLWLDYLSLAVVSQDFLSFQWDALLLETGLIAVCLAPPVVRERPADRVDPPQLARWLMLWLLFRLMIGSGAVKLASGDPTWRDLTAMTFHYETQPIPTSLAWYAHRLPVWFQKTSTAAVLAIELGAPWVMFASGRWRLAGFALLVGLQTLIALTGNYAFFNLLAAALCVFLLDDEIIDRWLRRARFARDAASGPSPSHVSPIRRLAILAFAIVTIPASIVIFTGGLRVGLPLPLAGDVATFVAPLRSVNRYGLFAVMTTVRDEIIVEGSNDGETWRPYEFRYKPGNVGRRPPWVAPHQPRLDWQMWFAVLSSYDNEPWYRNLCVRLLEGSPDVIRLLEDNPFPDRPPTYIRGVRYRYQYGETAWWTRERLGPYSPIESLAGSTR